jgi:hypothetical protein
MIGALITPSIVATLSSGIFQVKVEGVEFELPKCWAYRVNPVL